MGTWDSGPFSNDQALDFVGDLFDHVMTAIDDFLDEPEIDETFDAAFAAVAVLNALMPSVPTRPWKDGERVAAAPIRTAMLRCFDEQIDGLDPEEGYAVEQRNALVSALDRFVELVDGDLQH